MKEQLKDAINKNKRIKVEIRDFRDKAFISEKIVGFDEIGITLIDDSDVSFRLIPWSNIAQITILK